MKSLHIPNLEAVSYISLATQSLWVHLIRVIRGVLLLELHF